MICTVCVCRLRRKPCKDGSLHGFFMCIASLRCVGLVDTIRLVPVHFILFNNFYSMYHTLQRAVRLSKRGFTLLEVLLVIAIIGVLASIVIIALNPNKQLADTRNAQRKADVSAILNAVYQYDIDHSSMPSNTPTTTKEICRDSGACSGFVDLYSSLVPKYVVNLPIDPQASTTVSQSEIVGTLADRDFSADTGDWTTYANTGGHSNWFITGGVASSTANVLGGEMISSASDRNFSTDTGNWSTNANTGNNSNWGIVGGVASSAASTTIVALSLSPSALSSAIVPGYTYQITFTVNTLDTGVLTPNLGGVDGTAVGQTPGSNTQTQVIVAATSDAIMFTPDATWDGTIDNVSIKRIIPSGGSGVTTILSLATSSLAYPISTNSAYQVTFTVNTLTTGTLTPKIGGTNGTAVGQTVGSVTQTQTITSSSAPVTGNGPLMFVPNATWTGTIDNVSVMNTTRGSTGYSIVLGSDGRVTVSAPKAENGASISASK